MIHLEEFKAHLKEISIVYSGISKKIEELVITANELNSGENEIKILADRIKAFLTRIKTFISLEKKQAKQISWSREKKSYLIHLINQELVGINSLIGLMENEKKKPANQLIVKIYQLNKEVQKIMKTEEIFITSG